MKIRSKLSLHALTVAPHSVAVPALEKALGHREPDVRHAAATALQARGEVGFYALLRAAARGNRRQRQEAVTHLGHLRDVRALQPLLSALENDRRERTPRTFCRFMLATLATFAAVELSIPLWADVVRVDPDLQISAARALGNLGDVRAVLPLIRLTREPHVGVSLAARDALMQLLPHVAELPADRVRGLGVNAVPQLASLLLDHDEPLVRSTLIALHAIGDRQAIPAVERLANAPGRPYLHAEARLLLAVLMQRTQQEQLRTTLLRGSRVPAAFIGDDLLRPSVCKPACKTEGAQLLRPVGEVPNRKK